MPANLVSWIGCLAFSALLFNELAKARKNIFGGVEKAEPRAISPQPLEIRGAAEYVLIRDCVGRHADVMKQLDELRAERRGDMNMLHEKINGVGREVSEQTGTLEMQNQRLAVMDAKLDRVIERGLVVSPKK